MAVIQLLRLLASEFKSVEDKLGLKLFGPVIQTKSTLYASAKFDDKWGLHNSVGQTGNGLERGLLNTGYTPFK